MSETEGDDPVLARLAMPPEFDIAPSWARRLFNEQRQHQHATSESLMKMSSEIARFSNVLGREPNSDGEDGAGLIGDLRKCTRDVGELKNLKHMGTGFVGALTVFGALILTGVGQWITSIMHSIKS